MREPLRQEPMSVEAYLALEKQADVRHEYVAGYVYAMTGARLRHNAIILNIVDRLRQATRGGPCRVFTEGVKVRVGADRIYYPDALVTCGPQDLASVLAVDPCLVVEVVSQSSHRTDHIEKRDAYGAMTAIQSYLIVEQDRRQVTLVRRETDGAWRGRLVTDTHGGAILALPCPPLTLTLDEIYEGLDVPTAPPLHLREGVPV